MECYQPDSNTWQIKPSMSISRYSTGVGALGDTLFVVGGMTDGGPCKYVESFNSVKGTWSRLPDLNIARSSPAVIAVDDQLYVIGGHDGENFLSTIEMYDPMSNTWSMLPSNMNLGKKFVTAALIDESILKI